MKRTYSRSVGGQQQHEKQSPLARIGRRGRTQSNLWIFDSPKNVKRLTIAGDLNFMVCVLLESDISVAAYKVKPGPYPTVIDDEHTSIVPDLEVEYQHGKREWWEIRRSQTQHGKRESSVSPIARAAETAGIGYLQRTENDMVDKAVAFDNWLLLCAAMTRARHFPMHHESGVLHNLFEESRTATVGQLLRVATVDRGLMVATIARFLQAGRLSAELETTLFCEETVLTARAV